MKKEIEMKSDEKPFNCEQDVSLRDYFAAHAMAGIMANSGIVGTKTDCNERAEAAYIMADAMLKAKSSK